MTLGVVILVGGASSRMGRDKARLDWNGRGAVERLADVARALGADLVLTAGGGDFGLPRVDDGEAGGGPVAGMVAALAILREAGLRRALVLAVDAPTLWAEDIAPLLESPPPGAAYEGLNLPLVIDLAAASSEAGAGWSIRRFIEAAGLARPVCPPEAAERLRGANTPEERERLLMALVEAESAQNAGRS
ncbi:MAG: NTP transferase domain-containing protein [Pseudomonadota bacterium]